VGVTIICHTHLHWMLIYFSISLVVVYKILTFMSILLLGIVNGCGSSDVKDRSV